jgi:hypothetical protein
MATISRIGFGQLEPNHLSAQRNGQIYGQLPAAADIAVLENGQFVKYNYADNVCDFAGEGEWMLVYNEVKLYDSFWRESYKDFAMQKANYNRGELVPRVMKTMIGDIFTTNCLEGAGAKGVKFDGTEDLVVGAELSPNAQGYLSLTGDKSIVFQVVKVYTMPDGQAAVKVMRIK